MNLKFENLVYLFALFFILSCNNTVDHYKIPTYSQNNHLQAVIEISAGTNKKFEYNKETNSFQIDLKNGKERKIDFLPYVGNYGFIPSTLSDKKNGGDGDALDVLVLSESLPMGTVVEIVPIAMLRLIDNGELDYKIIANVVSTEKQIIGALTYKEFVQNYPEILNIIELWFLNYNKDDAAKIDGWGNELEAKKEVIKNKTE